MIKYEKKTTFTKPKTASCDQRARKHCLGTTPLEISIFYDQETIEASAFGLGVYYSTGHKKPRFSGWCPEYTNMSL